ncbi:hypothetical protein [Amycolatopsis tolypomycina]
MPDPAERRAEQPRPAPTTEPEPADEPGGERAQQHAPRDRQAPPPRRNR